MIVVVETEYSGYVLGNGFGDRLVAWKKESRIVLRFLT